MRVYLDNAATTPLAKEVLAEMMPFLENEFGNPSSTHSYGRPVKAAIESVRKTIASHLNCKPSELIFTSGGTEADNMAISCAIRELGVKHIITSPIEHHAVLHSVEYIQHEKDITVSYVNLTPNGHVDLAHLETLLQSTKDKTLVSLMHGNNEIGNLLPLKEVVKLCKEHNALFHSDTVQTVGHYAFDLTDLDIDFITCGAHKLHGPKGVGFLYVNKRHKIKPLIYGGSQERGNRGGTENTYGIVGLGKAISLAYEGLEEHQAHVQALKTYMKETLEQEIPDIQFNGDLTPENSLYTVLNVAFPENSKSGMLLFNLDLKGIACSGGSACSSGSNQGSHVLNTLNVSRPSVRFSFSRYTTKEEIDYAISAIKESVLVES